MKIKFNGEFYQIEKDEPLKPSDGFILNNKVVDEIPPKARYLGYIELEEGSVFQVYKKTNSLIPIIFVLTVLILIGVIVVTILLTQKKPVVIGDAMIREGVGNNIVTFNAMMKYSEGNVDVRFINGKEPCYITVSGEGIESQAVLVNPEESLYSLPVTFNTTESVVEVLVTFNTESSKATFNAIVEVPENSHNIETGTNDFFYGEHLYEY